MSRILSTVTLATALIAIPCAASAQAHTMVASRGGALEWAPIQPPGFDPGMEIAVLAGDPSAPDQAYTLRLRFRDGYRFPSHYHPKTENLTVLSGALLLRMAATETGELTEYQPGDYLHIPATQPHWGGARGQTVIQLHGVGPFDIILSNPAKAAKQP